MRFDGKVVIVTGGAGGIGLATAQRFASEGAKVVIADYDAAKSAAAAAGLKAAGATDAWGAACDVSKEDQVEACCQGAVDRFGSLDVVVNNAGLMLFSLIEDTKAEDFLRVLGVDLMGAFFFTKHAFKRMKSGSAIVNIASVHAVQTSPMAASYAAAKAGVLSLTRTASIEGKPKGIRVNAILPGAVDTPMLWDNPNVKSGAETVNKADVGEPKDLAAAIAFLASDDAAFMTGSSVTVDGGRLAKL